MISDAFCCLIGTITSGLGDATPTCLLIIPFKYNDQVEAVMEVAGFEKFEEYQIRFLEKAGEFMASAILTVKTAERTERLLHDSQHHSEMLKAQEEEMRQNMGEMAATQEEVHRRQAKSEQMKQQIEALLESARLKEHSLQSIINNTDDSIIAFDTQYQIITFNEAYRTSNQQRNHIVAIGDNILHGLDRLPADEQKHLKSQYDRMLNGEKFSVEEYFLIEGVPTQYLINYAPLYNLI